MGRSRPVFHDRHQSSRGNQIALESFNFSQSNLEKNDINQNQVEVKSNKGLPMTTKNSPNKPKIQNIEQLANLTGYSQLIGFSGGVTYKGKQQMLSQNYGPKTQNKFAQREIGQIHMTSRFYKSRDTNDAKTLPLIGSERQIKKDLNSTHLNSRNMSKDLSSNQGRDNNAKSQKVNN